MVSAISASRCPTGRSGPLVLSIAWCWVLSTVGMDPSVVGRRRRHFLQVVRLNGLRSRMVADVGRQPSARRINLKEVLALPSTHCVR